MDDGRLVDIIQPMGKDRLSRPQRPLWETTDTGGEIEAADPVDADARALRAWSLVAEGYRLALRELWPGDENFERLKRCLRHAERMAGEPLLTLAQAPQRRPATG
jgi:hypothetical protein